MSIHRTIESLKSAGQDFEFYPTTNEIIARLIHNLKTDFSDYYGRTHYREKAPTAILDIGAGNGKVLLAVRAAVQSENLCFDEFHAIEKSALLCEAMDPAIFVIGTDLHEQSLMAKTAAVTFCNPPYSEFTEWAVKIIRESASRIIYLVIPERWQNSLEIQAALEYRQAKATIAGAFDFLDSEDRTARAKVHLLRIKPNSEETAFAASFRSEFADFISKFNEAPAPKMEAEKDGRAGQIVSGADFPAMLVSLYNDQMQRIQKNYRAVSTLEPELLKEFNVIPETVMKCLQERLNGLRSTYWTMLFNRLEAITNRLTSKSRAGLLDTLHANRNVDFTLGNIHAVIVWCLKKANSLIGSQLISVYERMIDKANVRMYKSNHRAFVDGWRYEESGNSHFALDYRIVTHRVGGFNDGDSWQKGLSENAMELLQDLCTVARTLGFSVGHDQLADRRDWKAGEAVTVEFRDSTGKPEPLFNVRAFKNRNLHLKLNQEFILALNVEHGRLKGWIKTPAEAADEIQDPAAAARFGTVLQLPLSNPGNLLG